jgi:hypothetical protein
MEFLIENKYNMVNIDEKQVNIDAAKNDGINSYQLNRKGKNLKTLINNLGL